MFQLHSSFVWTAIDSFRRHLKCIPAEFSCNIELDSGNNQDAFAVHSNSVETHSGHSVRIRSGLPFRFSLEWDRVFWMLLESRFISAVIYAFNAVRYFSNTPIKFWAWVQECALVFGIHTESSQIFKMQFNYQRIHNRFLFQQHSRSFWHYRGFSMFSFINDKNEFLKNHSVHIWPM